MFVFFMVVLLVVAAIAANIVYAIYPKIPLAFYQIGAGLVLSLLPTFGHFQLEPEIFLLVIIAPLMFNDGQSTDYHVLKKNIRSTLSLAVVLALVTIVGGGLLSHAMWPAIPLALAFGLAAIVTPTDAVAVSSITTGIDMPEPVLGALENESLFNDASGIVALDLALTAFSTGHFSVGQGIEHFLIVFLGGIFVGIILGGAIVLLRLYFQRRGLDAIAVILPFNLLTPFIVYLAAEHLGVSGILAVVATGIIHGIQQRRLRLTSTQTQVVTTTTWEVLTNLLNGFVFVLLGEAMPSVWANLSHSDSKHLPLLIMIAVGLYLLMGILRFIWCQLNLVDLKSKETRLKDGLILSLSGVHGTITLAMAFSLPLTLNGHVFPFRTALIFVAGIVILLSLLVPTLILPLLLPKKQEAFTQEEFNDQLVRMVNFAITQLKQTEADSTALNPVIEVLSSQKNQLRSTADSKQVHKLLQLAENAEHAAIFELIDAGDVEAQIGWQYDRMQLMQVQFAFLNPFARLTLWFRLVAFRLFPHQAKKRYHKQLAQTIAAKKKAKQQMMQELTTRHPEGQLALPVTTDQQQQLIQTNPSSNRSTDHRHNLDHHQRREVRHTLTRQQRREVRRQFQSSTVKSQYWSNIAKLEQTGFNTVTAFLDSIETDDNQQEVNVIRHYYTVRHNRFNQSTSTVELENELFIMAFQFEYSYVQTAGKQEQLSPELIGELHKKISMDQLVYMQSTN